MYSQSAAVFSSQVLPLYSRLFCVYGLIDVCTLAKSKTNSLLASALCMATKNLQYRYKHVYILIGGRSTFSYSCNVIQKSSYTFFLYFVCAFDSHNTERKFLLPSMTLASCALTFSLTNDALLLNTVRCGSCFRCISHEGACLELL